MPRTPTRPPSLRGRVFCGSEQIRAGRITRGQLRSSAWRRLFPDVYACATLPVDHARRARAVAVLALPGAVISGRSAAVLWGVDLADPDDDVECTLPREHRAGTLRGVRVTRRALPPDDVVQRGKVRLTTPRRTALDLARIEPTAEAVVCIDRFVRAGLVGLDSLRRDAAALSGPGCRVVRRALELADGVAESPQETRLRLVLDPASLQGPAASSRAVGGKEVLRFVARVDFGWPEARVALEYEGIWHGQSQQVARDRRRLNELSAAGWTVVFATAADLHDPVALSPASPPPCDCRLTSDGRPEGLDSCHHPYAGERRDPGHRGPVIPCVHTACRRVGPSTCGFPG